MTLIQNQIAVALAKARPGVFADGDHQRWQGWNSAMVHVAVAIIDVEERTAFINLCYQDFPVR